MTTKLELAERLELGDPEAGVWIGYDLAEIDQTTYFHWALDCAEHLLPICQQAPLAVPRLQAALKTARDFINGAATETELQQAVKTVENIKEFLPTPYYADLFEAVWAIENAVKLSLPESRMYHEDVIYGAARAAWHAAGGQAEDAYPPPSDEENDCCESDELVEAESLKERLWQVGALQARLLDRTS